MVMSQAGRFNAAWYIDIYTKSQNFPCECFQLLFSLGAVCNLCPLSSLLSLIIQQATHFTIQTKYASTKGEQKLKTIVKHTFRYFTELQPELQTDALRLIEPFSFFFSILAMYCLYIV